MPDIAHLSYSSLALYLECSRKWRYRYLDKLPAPKSPALVFGSAIHATVEGILAAKHADTAYDLSSGWKSAWAAVQSDDIEWGADFPELFEQDGLRLLTSPAVTSGLAMLAAAEADGAPVIERRVEWHVDGVPVPVIGYLDLIAADGVIADLKTASRRWTYEQALGEAQPIVYLAALAQEGAAHTPGVFRHVVMVKTREPQFQLIETERQESDLDWMAGVVRHVWRGIERGHYGANPKACYAWGRKCEYFDHCRKER